MSQVNTVSAGNFSTYGVVRHNSGAWATCPPLLGCFVFGRSMVWHAPIPRFDFLLDLSAMLTFSLPMVLMNIAGRNSEPKGDGAMVFQSNRREFRETG